MERAPQLPALTGLRFVAAMLVVCCHYASGLSLPAPVHAIASAGGLGVNLFFILSGFILAYTYLDNGGSRRATLRAFWVARVARIYPVYLLGLALALPAYIHSHNPHATPGVTVLAGLTLTQAWLPWSSIAWDSPAWSLSAEAFFYLVFPVVAIQIARLRVRMLCVVAGLLWLAALLPPAIYVIVQPDGAITHPHSGVVFWLLSLRMNPMLRLPEFALGIALGRLYTLHRLSGRPAPRARWATLAAIVALASMAWAPVSVSLWATNGLLDPVFAALIYTLAWRRGPLATCPLQRLGEASYALYLLHVPLYWWMAGLLRVTNADHSVLFFLTYAGLVIAFSLLAFRLVEEPGRTAIRRHLSMRILVAVR